MAPIPSSLPCATARASHVEGNDDSLGNSIDLRISTDCWLLLGFKSASGRESLRRITRRQTMTSVMTVNN
jgi:hypothetical protein